MPPTLPITYEQLVALSSTNVPTAYTERDTLLYAVAIGMGRDPLNRDELRYVFENYPLRTMPTQAVVVARQNLTWDIGLDVGKFLHGEQRLTLHRPMPVEASILADHRITEVFDRGPGKGSILQLDTTGYVAGDPRPLFEIFSLIFARGQITTGDRVVRVPARGGRQGGA